MPKAGSVNPTQNVDEHAIQALLVEYQIHGAELAKRLDLQDRNLIFLQGFAVAIGGAVAALLSKEKLVSTFKTIFEANQLFAAISFLVALAVALQMGASMIASSYVFMVLRRRMAEIETKVNEIIQKPDLLRYERSVARNFFELARFSDSRTSPTFVSSFAAYSTLLLLIALLVATSLMLLPERRAIDYGTTAFCGCAFLLWKARNTVSTAGQKELDCAYKSCTPPNTAFSFAPLLVAISTWIATVLLVHWTLFGLPSPLRDGYVAIYSFLTGAMLPLPSEAPVLLVKSVGDFDVFLYAALGKALSALTLVYLARSAVLAWWPARHNRLLNRFRFGANGVISWGIYFLCQAIPFFPMRTSTLAIGSMTTGIRTAIGIALVCGCATIIRMLLILVLLSYGIAAAKAIFP